MNDLKTWMAAASAQLARLPAIPMEPTMTATRALRWSLAIVPSLGGFLG